MPGYEYIQIGDQNNDRGKTELLYAERLTPIGPDRIRTFEPKSAPLFGSHITHYNKELARFRALLTNEGWNPIPGFERFLARPLREGTPAQEYEYSVIFSEFPGGAEVVFDAHQLTPHEAVLIYRVSWELGDQKAEEESCGELEARLASAGWEPIGDPSVRSGALMKRRLDAKASAERPTSSAGANPVETLKQLAELRDSGVLTEEEFEGKKKDILAEM